MLAARMLLVMPADAQSCVELFDAAAHVEQITTSKGLLQPAWPHSPTRVL
jgi:hypothetical protein